MIHVPRPLRFPIGLCIGWVVGIVPCGAGEVWDQEIMAQPFDRKPFHATVMRQAKDGAERLVVHLFNDLNTTAGHAFPNDDVPLREEVVPIDGIRVTFRPGYRFRRVHLEPEGRDLDVEKTPDGSRVIVPRLEVHSMVVGELEATHQK